MQKELTLPARGRHSRLGRLLGVVLVIVALFLSLAVMAPPQAHAATTHSQDTPYPVACDGNQVLEVDYEAALDGVATYNGSFCFSGSGYLGYAIAGVVGVTYNATTNDGWLRLYDGDYGWYFHLPAAGIPVSWSPDAPLYMTQICLNDPGCPVYLDTIGTGY